MAVPVRVEDLAPAAPAVTEMVAVLLPVVCAVSGVNDTVTTHDAFGASVVCPKSCPPPAGPQEENALLTVNSLTLVPPSTPCVIPVNGMLPVLVRVNTWVGHVNKPQPRVALGVHEVGVSVALLTCATAVPVSWTGEPFTVTFAAMAAVPLEEVTPIPGE